MLFKGRKDGKMYNYKDGKSRILQILNNEEKIIKKAGIPKNEDEFTYNNGILAWTSAIFVDIRDSSSLMGNEGSVELAKILKLFVSEVLEILNQEKDLVRELGIRGDCVYGIYSTRTDEQEYKVFELTIIVNTCIIMINKLLKRKGLTTIKVGIGFSCDYEFIVKAGRKGTGENDRIWIGNAVHKASNLSGIMNKDIKEPIGLNPQNISYIKEQLKKENPTKNTDSWLTEFLWKGYKYYKCSLINHEFNDWINNEC